MKLATYNIYVRSDPSQIVESILRLKKEGVSIFCLQEVNKIAGRPFVGDLLQKSLGKDWKIAYHLGENNSYLGHGLALVWNTAILKNAKVEKAMLPKLLRFSWIHRTLSYFLGFHGIPSERRILTATFLWKGKLLRVSTTHIDAFGTLTQRIMQDEALHLFLQKKKPVKYEIICGDFNTLRGFTYRTEMKKLLQMFTGYTESCKGIRWTQDMHYCTFPHKFFTLLVKKCHLHYKQNLDHILSKGFAIQETKRSNAGGSDHFPLIIDLD